MPLLVAVIAVVVPSLMNKSSTPAKQTPSQSVSQNSTNTVQISESGNNFSNITTGNIDASVDNSSRVMTNDDKDMLNE